MNQYYEGGLLEGGTATTATHANSIHELSVYHRGTAARPDCCCDNVVKRFPPHLALILVLPWCAIFLFFFRIYSFLVVLSSFSSSSSPTFPSSCTNSVR